jgi:glycosyltransferase involved in cell wall biosynthesis
LKIKIVLFFTYGVSLKTWAETGLLQREIKLYQELIKHYGVKVTFLTYGDSTDREWENELGNIQLLPIYERLARPKSKIFRFLQSFIIPFYFWKKLIKSDLFKTNQILGSWVAVVSKIIHKKPLLVRCGYEAYKNSMQTGNRKLFHYLIWFFSIMAYKCADHIWLNSKEMALFVKKTFSIKPHKITVAQNWIDTKLFFPFKKAKHKKKILFVGRFSKEKNIPMLLHALEGTDIGLDLVGAGDIRQGIKDLAHQLGVKVDFLGRFSNNEMPGIYNRYLVYVLCSHYEGNPKTLLEAMVCGCAVVGTDVPGIRNVLIHNKSGLLVTPNVQDLQQAIKQLLTNPTLCSSLGKNARDYIIKNNSIGKYIREEMHTYRKLVRITRD